MSGWRLPSSAAWRLWRRAANILSASALTTRMDVANIAMCAAKSSRTGCPPPIRATTSPSATSISGQRMNPCGRPMRLMPCVRPTGCTGQRRRSRRDRPASIERGRRPRRPTDVRIQLSSVCAGFSSCREGCGLSATGFVWRQRCRLSPQTVPKGESYV